MENKKLKVLLQSDFSLAATGFGKVMRHLLTYLYQTGKYDIIHYCCGLNFSNPELQRTSWKSIGSLPDNPQEIEHLQKDPNLMRSASYGGLLIDQVIKNEKPDIWIGIQDPWAFTEYYKKPWFNKITSVIWTTLDSLPTLPEAIEQAKNSKNYWIWSDFATKDLHRLGYKHVKTVHGALKTSDFYRLPNIERKLLRSNNNIPDDSFIIGFVFRNQLRKLVPNLLEGYSLWKKDHQNDKSFLLLHTNFSEGWNIHRLAEQYGVKKEEILTTYICKNCKNYEVKIFDGQDKDCKFCNSKKSQITTNVNLGVNEERLNEIYNLMDVYYGGCTSGGMEIPIGESKLTELITLVNDYSCGEEWCYPEASSLTLDWAKYTEHGTEFIKASTYPSSVAKCLNRVFNMTPVERQKMGKKARDWTIENFDISKVGGFLENFLDSCPPCNYEMVENYEQKHPDAQVENLDDNDTWILDLYKKILNMSITKQDDGFLYWSKALSQGMKRSDVENYFRKVAVEENNKNNKIEFEDLLLKDDAGKRVVLIMPESIGDVFMITSLFRSIKEKYPWCSLYVATKPQYKEILEGNEYVAKVLDYNPQFDHQLWLEGRADHKGYFELSFHPYFGSQKMLSYLNNGKTELAYNINY